MNEINKRYTRLPTTVDIISDIRNKLQAQYLIIERIAEGKPVTERIVSLAINELDKVEKLLS